MSKLRKSVLDLIQYIGDNSGCHQMPERSFYFYGWQFPLCARCTGVAIGQIAAMIFFVFKITLSVPFSFIMLMTMGFDWYIQEIGIKESNNKRRFVTGILGGFGIVSLYLNVIKIIWNKIK